MFLEVLVLPQNKFKLLLIVIMVDKLVTCFLGLEAFKAVLEGIPIAH